jgi:hypothetical protein
MKTKLLAWDRQSAFEYRNENGTISVFYGGKSEFSLTLGAPLYDELIRTFAGKTVRINHCLAEENIEDWLVQHGAGKKITRYLAPILRHEGYAVEGARRGTITFR